LTSASVNVTVCTCLYEQWRAKHMGRRLPDSRIKAAMAALPEQFRITVYYADIEGLRYRQIAEIMNTPLGTVMSRLHRGRSRLRLLLSDTTEDTTTGPAASMS
jgi:RNA polymerase sigma-70 factor (ECF subfamily)